TLLKHQSLLILLVLLSTLVALAQQQNDDTTRPMPKEVRGYKVHRAQVEMKKPDESSKKKSDEKSEKEKFERDDYDETEPILVRLGDPQLVGVTPRGITFDVPVIIAPVTHQGDVDLL